LQNAKFTTRVPGVAYAGWGSSDMSFSLGTPGVKDTPERARRPQPREGREHRPPAHQEPDAVVTGPAATPGGRDA
jgi:hypothetical protein